MPRKTRNSIQKNTFEYRTKEIVNRFLSLDKSKYKIAEDKLTEAEQHILLYLKAKEKLFTDKQKQCADALRRMPWKYPAEIVRETVRENKKRLDLDSPVSTKLQSCVVELEKLIADIQDNDLLAPLAEDCQLFLKAYKVHLKKCQELEQQRGADFWEKLEPLITSPARILGDIPAHTIGDDLAKTMVCGDGYNNPIKTNKTGNSAVEKIGDTDEQSMFCKPDMRDSDAHIQPSKESKNAWTIGTPVDPQKKQYSKAPIEAGNSEAVCLAYVSLPFDEIDENTIIKYCQRELSQFPKIKAQLAPEFVRMLAPIKTLLDNRHPIDRILGMLTSYEVALGLVKSKEDFDNFAKNYKFPAELLQNKYNRDALKREFDALCQLKKQGLLRDILAGFSKINAGMRQPKCGLDHFKAFLDVQTYVCQCRVEEKDSVLQAQFLSRHPGHSRLLTCPAVKTQPVQITEAISGMSLLHLLFLQKGFYFCNKCLDSDDFKKVLTLLCTQQSLTADQIAKQVEDIFMGSEKFKAAFKGKEYEFKRIIAGLKEIPKLFPQKAGESDMKYFERLKEKVPNINQHLDFEAYARQVVTNSSLTPADGKPDNLIYVFRLDDNQELCYGRIVAFDNDVDAEEGPISSCSKSRKVTKKIKDPETNEIKQKISYEHRVVHTAAEKFVPYRFTAMHRPISKELEQDFLNANPVYRTLEIAKILLDLDKKNQRDIALGADVTHLDIPIDYPEAYLFQNENLFRRMQNCVKENIKKGRKTTLHDLLYAKDPAVAEFYRSFIKRYHGIDLKEPIASQKAAIEKFLGKSLASLSSSSISIQEAINHQSPLGKEVYLKLERTQFPIEDWNNIDSTYDAISIEDALELESSKPLSNEQKAIKDYLKNIEPSYQIMFSDPSEEDKKAVKAGKSVIFSLQEGNSFVIHYCNKRGEYCTKTMVKKLQAKKLREIYTKNANVTSESAVDTAENQRTKVTVKSGADIMDIKRLVSLDTSFRVSTIEAIRMYFKKDLDLKALLNTKDFWGILEDIAVHFDFIDALTISDTKTLNQLLFQALDHYVQCKNRGESFDIDKVLQLLIRVGADVNAVDVRHDKKTLLHTILADKKFEPELLETVLAYQEPIILTYGFNFSADNNKLFRLIPQALSLEGLNPNIPAKFHIIQVDNLANTDLLDEFEQSHPFSMSGEKPTATDLTNCFISRIYDHKKLADILATTASLTAEHKLKVDLDKAYYIVSDAGLKQLQGKIKKQSLISDQVDQTGKPAVAYLDLARKDLERVLLLLKSYRINLNQTYQDRRFICRYYVINKEPDSDFFNKVDSGERVAFAYINNAWTLYACDKEGNRLVWKVEERSEIRQLNNIVKRHGYQSMAIKNAKSVATLKNLSETCGASAPCHDLLGDYMDLDSPSLSVVSLLIKYGAETLPSKMYSYFYSYISLHEKSKKDNAISEGRKKTIQVNADIAGISVKSLRAKRGAFAFYYMLNKNTHPYDDSNQKHREKREKYQAKFIELKSQELDQLIQEANRKKDSALVKKLNNAKDILKENKFSLVLDCINSGKRLLPPSIASQLFDYCFNIIPANQDGVRKVGYSGENLWFKEFLQTIAHYPAHQLFECTGSSGGNPFTFGDVVVITNALGKKIPFWVSLDAGLINKEDKITSKQKKKLKEFFNVNLNDVDVGVPAGEKNNYIHYLKEAFDKQDPQKILQYLYDIGKGFPIYLLMDKDEFRPLIPYIDKLSYSNAQAATDITRGADTGMDNVIVVPVKKINEAGEEYIALEVKVLDSEQAFGPSVTVKEDWHRQIETMSFFIFFPDEMYQGHPWEFAKHYRERDPLADVMKWYMICVIFSKKIHARFTLTERDQLENEEYTDDQGSECFLRLFFDKYYPRSLLDKLNVLKNYAFTDTRMQLLYRTEPEVAAFADMIMRENPNLIPIRLYAIANGAESVTKVIEKSEGDSSMYRTASMNRQERLAELESGNSREIGLQGFYDQIKIYVTEMKELSKVIDDLKIGNTTSFHSIQRPESFNAIFQQIEEDKIKLNPATLELAYAGPKLKDTNILGRIRRKRTRGTVSEIMSFDAAILTDSSQVNIKMLVPLVRNANLKALNLNGCPIDLERFITKTRVFLLFLRKLSLNDVAANKVAINYQSLRDLYFSNQYSKSRVNELIITSPRLRKLIYDNHPETRYLELTGRDLKHISLMGSFKLHGNLMQIVCTNPALLENPNNIKLDDFTCLKNPIEWIYWCAFHSFLLKEDDSFWSQFNSQFLLDGGSLSIGLAPVTDFALEAILKHSKNVIEDVNLSAAAYISWRGIAHLLKLAHYLKTIQLPDIANLISHQPKSTSRTQLSAILQKEKLKKGLSKTLKKKSPEGKVISKLGRIHAIVPNYSGRLFILHNKYLVVSNIPRTVSGNLKSHILARSDYNFTAMLKIPQGILTGDSEGHINLWDDSDIIFQAKPKKVFPKLNNKITSLSYSPKSNTLLCTTFKSKNITVWNLDTYKKSLFSTRDSIYKQVKFITDDIFIAVSENSIQLWSLKTGRRVDATDYETHSRTINDVEILSDHSFVTISNDRMVQLHEIEFQPKIKCYRCKLIKSLKGHESVVTAVCLLTSNVLVTGDNSGKIIFWNLTTGLPIQECQESHNDTIAHLALDANGALYSSSKSKEILTQYPLKTYPLSLNVLSYMQRHRKSFTVLEKANQLIVQLSPGKYVKQFKEFLTSMLSQFMGRQFFSIEQVGKPNAAHKLVQLCLSFASNQCPNDINLEHKQMALELLSSIQYRIQQPLHWRFLSAQKSLSFLSPRPSSIKMGLNRTVTPVKISPEKIPQQAPVKPRNNSANLGTDGLKFLPPTPITTFGKYNSSSYPRRGKKAQNPRRGEKITLPPRLPPKPFSRIKK